MMNDISYWIPTQGRLHRGSPAMDMMELAKLDEITHVVCPQKEIAKWHEFYPGVILHAQPEGIVNIGQLRAWMFETCITKYFFMIDDDVSFSHQLDVDPRRTTKADTDPERLREVLYDLVCAFFKEYPAVGIGSRLFCNTRHFVERNKQTGWAWGYDKEKTGSILRPIMGRLKVHEDTDWCITLLEHGLPNVILSHVVASSRKVANSPSEGGCGIYRTAKLVDEETRKFISFHPGIVTPREPRAGLHEATQYRHTVHWKKAFRAIEEGRLG